MFLTPPMKDHITLLVKQLDEFGKPVVNRNGVAARVPVQSKARVQHSSKIIYTSTGAEVNAVLEVDVPPDLEIRSGDIINWTDRFGVLISGPVEQLSEALSANGEKVWFRTALTI